MTERPPAVLQLLELGLRRVRRGWTQFAPARKANGVPCDPNGSTAVEWCATGAAPIDRLDPNLEKRQQTRQAAFALLRTAIRDVTPEDADHTHLTHWNDAQGRTQAQCIRLYELAIETARELAVRTT